MGEGGREYLIPNVCKVTCQISSIYIRRNKRKELRSLKNNGDFVLKNTILIFV